MRSDPARADGPGLRAPARRSLAGVVGRTALALVLGFVVGVLGTVAHRAEPGGYPLGVVLAFAVTLSTAVLCRAWAGFGALLTAGAGWIVAVQALSVTGPGGDIVVPAEPVGIVWTYGGLALFAVAAFLPGSWFSDRPVRRAPDA